MIRQVIDDDSNTLGILTYHARINSIPVSI